MQNSFTVRAIPAPVAFDICIDSRSQLADFRCAMAAAAIRPVAGGFYRRVRKRLAWLSS